MASGLLHVTQAVHNGHVVLHVPVDLAEWVASRPEDGRLEAWQRLGVVTQSTDADPVLVNELLAWVSEQGFIPAGNTVNVTFEEIEGLPWQAFAASHMGPLTAEREAVAAECEAIIAAAGLPTTVSWRRAAPQLVPV